MPEVNIDPEAYMNKLQEQRDMHANGEAALAGQLGIAAARIRELTERIKELEADAAAGRGNGKSKDNSHKSARSTADRRNKDQGAVLSQ